MTKILVIEDESSVRANLLELLDAEEYDAVGAENGMIGVMWALEHLPDLIICDVMMPEFDGYEVLRLLRQEPATATIPFIFLTAKADRSDLRQGMDLGADDYLTKPFTRSEILSAIETRLAKVSALKEQYGACQQDTAALQNQIRVLQQQVSEQEGLLVSLREQIQGAVPKINVAIHMMKNLESPEQRDRCLQLLQDVYADELELINQIPNLDELLPEGNLDLLRELRLLS
ncbi:response regulator [Synechococcales cyanobacterium C]|uniref:Response regulator n=1 Tax=Petrachloros mirabilis ULC683 TaxID=2781853 RepID=A0A8K1ZWR6_9CYAN|nr:response regulator [Petrachloros mirabilis]NCJ05077.1 response regulator [Petrachloros mirabilis ULC683]